MSHTMVYPKPTMLGLTITAPPTPPLLTHQIRPFTTHLRPLKPLLRLHRITRRAADKNGADGVSRNTNPKKDPKGIVDDDGGDGGDGPRLNLDWARLLLDPDPDNVLAVGLTGLLAWASVQVLWQLLVVSVAIVVAALKYSFVAGLLLFILVTLL